MYEPVAIIGFGLRLPGASSGTEFWNNLVAGRESLTRFTAAELTAAGADPRSVEDDSYVPVRGVVPFVADLDIGFFGLAPLEARITDPQHRVFLECAYEALETAGYAGETPYRIGVFAGAGVDTYLPRHVAPHPEVIRSAGQMAMNIAHEKDYLATRVAYRLGLTGPALSVQTACSTSLAAVHLAARALGNAEADIMLAGGVTIDLPQAAGYFYRPHDILSPDGHCRTFDARACGTVPGNGAAVVVLKRLEDALRDDDVVYAVLAGSAVNNDGPRKAGYTTPSVPGQTDVIRAALDAARLSPGAVQYIETHGTATEVGDTTEVESLREVFGEAPGSRVLGALKPNIGHVDTAAGAAGLIKAALALHHGHLPPTINFSTPNPALKLEDGRFEVLASGRRWDAADGQRVCGVSSFGIGGTNAHVVLVEAPARRPRLRTSADPAIVPISARTATATSAVAVRLLGMAAAGDSRPAPGGPATLADIAFTLQRGRPAWEHRAASVIGDLTELSATDFGLPVRTRPDTAPVFLFSGTSRRSAGAAAGLADRFPVFDEAVRECDAALRPALGVDFVNLVRHGGEPASFPQAQALIFTLQCAMARLLDSFGIEPANVLGHSLGEYAAAWYAGGISLADAARLVVARSEIGGRVPDGMLAAFAAPDVVTPLLTADLSIAAVNGPSSLAVSGPPTSLAALAQRLQTAGHKAHLLAHIEGAFHSPRVDPVLDQFRAHTDEVAHHPLRVPMISTVTGGTIPAGARLDGGYWVRHLRQPVRFQQAGTRLIEETGAALVPIELGPGTMLTQLLATLDTDGVVSPVAALPAAPGEIDPVRGLLQAVADVWCAGVAVRWDSPGLQRGGRRTPLPTYPFERTRHWLDPVSPEAVPEQQPPPLELEPEPAAVETDAVPPADDDTQVVAVLTTIWRDLLGVQEIAAEDTFFSLGGQSLAAVRLIAAVKQRFGVTVPLAAVLRDPTIAGMTAAVQSKRRETGALMDSR
ncbi:type I polyketide synthase [Actinoplanes aureus]|uniref:Acyltransferase domain-containing protein n=1 Tax=Actinoplanes aureus TaxID=2792083 RepID=A0A931C4D5_9ACTN|nr:type I polyketide synthase [Actinoplanes aureus]MBG0560228.1 acyltransferase domain-containing protein [Actinoplanes aureus]